MADFLVFALARLHYVTMGSGSFKIRVISLKYYPVLQPQSFCVFLSHNRRVSNRANVDEVMVT